MKVVKKLKVDEIYEIDGGFFRIEKQIVKRDKFHKEYSRHFLRTVASPDKMKKLKEVLEQ